MAGVVFGLFVATAPVSAQNEDVTFPGVTANPDVIYDCLTDGNAVQECIATMTTRCQAENALQNENLKERLCVVEELNTWRGLLQREAALLQDQLAAQPLSGAASDDPLRTMAKASAFWQDWHQEQCRMERLALVDHPRRAIVQDICLRDLTAQQYQRLRNTRDSSEAR